jgi:hypothetical protein
MIMHVQSSIHGQLRLSDLQVMQNMLSQHHINVLLAISKVSYIPLTKVISHFSDQHIHFCISYTMCPWPICMRLVLSSHLISSVVPHCPSFSLIIASPSLLVLACLSPSILLCRYQIHNSITVHHLPSALGCFLSVVCHQSSTFHPSTMYHLHLIT